MAMVFCTECGVKISDQAYACPKCGAPNKANPSDKKWWIAFLLVWLVGIIGGHRYYMGQTTSAIIMTVLTCTFFGLVITSVWAFVDMIVLICHAGDDKWVNDIASAKK